MWVGVGSVCNRNRNPAAIAHILSALQDERPDLRFHGFGVKRTVLLDPPSASSYGAQTPWHGAPQLASKKPSVKMIGTRLSASAYGSRRRAVCLSDNGNRA